MSYHHKNWVIINLFKLYQKLGMYLNYIVSEHVKLMTGSVIAIILNQIWEIIDIQCLFNFILLIILSEQSLICRTQTQFHIIHDT